MNHIIAILLLMVSLEMLDGRREADIYEPRCSK